MIPVLHRSSGLDLRVKTVHIVMTCDFLLHSDAVEKLNEKWKDSGTVWDGKLRNPTQ